MGSLNELVAAREHTPVEVNAVPAMHKEKKSMKGYAVFLLQLGFSLLFVIAAFFAAYGNFQGAEAVAAFLEDNLSMQSSWLFPEEAIVAETSAPVPYRLPCGGDIKKAMVRNGEGGLDVAGFAFAGEPGEMVFAMAAGTVSHIAEGDSGFVLQVDHNDEIYSVYSGLDELAVAEGDAVGTEAPLGDLGAEGLLFAVYINGAPVDPTSLFGQIKK